MNKETETVEIFGEKFPKWQDCEWCKSKLSVKFNDFVYDQPCDDCKNTEKYDNKLKEAKKKKEEMTMDEMFSAGKAKAVWEGGGRTIMTDRNGNIVSNEPYKPMRSGQKVVKKHTTIMSGKI